MFLFHPETGEAALLLSGMYFLPSLRTKGLVFSGKSKIIPNTVMTVPDKKCRPLLGDRHFCCGKGQGFYLSCFFSDGARIRFAMIPRMRAVAMEVSVTFPKEIESPPIPQIRITATTKRL